MMCFFAERTASRQQPLPVIFHLERHSTVSSAPSMIGTTVGASLVMSKHTPILLEITSCVAALPRLWAPVCIAISLARKDGSGLMGGHSYA